MTMHATLGREAEVEDSALFFTALPDSRDAQLVEPIVERSVYGARGPSWSTILMIVAAHLAALYAMVAFDVIEIKPKTKVLVVDLIAEPPTPPAEQPKPEPVVVEKIKPMVEAPPPLVQTLAPPPPPIAVTSAPPPPSKPVTVSAPPPSGPVTIGNLDERLLEGRPPRYPMESRRKKEQGTVVLRLLIGTDGRVAQISVAESSGFERLDQAALQAVRGWRWRPLTRDGQPVEVRGLYSMPFALQG